MYLSRVHLNLRCKEARRDLADPYQLHSTLCRAFSPPDRKCPEGQFLWRHEPEVDFTGYPRILVQSNASPNWDGVGVNGWLIRTDPPIDLNGRLGLGQLKVGQKFRFRLRANPCVCRAGKRLGLLQQEEQEAWIQKQGQTHGFALPFFPLLDFSNESPKRVDVKIGQERMLHGRQRGGNTISIFSVLYDGLLSVTETEKFKEALRTGIGHGKSMGLGLLSVFPVG